MINGNEQVLLERMMHFSPDMVCLFDREGNFLKVNEACKEILGYEINEVEGKNVEKFVHRDDLAVTLGKAHRSINGTKIVNFENRYLHRSGRVVPMQWSGGWSEDDEAYFFIGRDISAELQARDRLREKDEIYNALIENGDDMLALFDQNLNFLYSGGSTRKIMGYAPEFLKGKACRDFVHPTDIPLLEDSLVRTLSSEGVVRVPAFRFRDIDGNWKWLQTSVSNQINNPYVKALVTSSRDITNRIYNRQKLEESQQRFRALFEANPDIVIFENREGVILDANPSASFYLRKDKEDIINRLLSDFLPAEARPVCNESLQAALEGKQLSFEMEVEFDLLGKRVLDVTKIPVQLDNEVVGVYTIARDITAIHTSGELIRQQAKKLHTIFESITDAFFTLDRDWNFTYVNSEFERLLLVKKETCVGRNIWNIFPEEVEGVFNGQFNLAAETGRAVHFEAYLARVNKWLQVKVFPSAEGLSVYFDDVTERVKSKQELEKLSLVASKTTNGVMILDAGGVTEWVNEGFTQITGYSFSEAVGKRPGEILKGEETDESTVRRMEEKRIQGKPFSEEILNYKKTGEKVWLSLEITPILDESGKVSRFINIQTDVTYRKLAEEEQLQLTKDLFLQNRDLQQFTYMVSHNLRSPLANAMGLVNLLQEVDKESDTFDQSLAYLKESVLKLDTVLQDMNMILSLRSRKDVLEQDRIPLAQLFQESLDGLREPMAQSGGVVEVDIGEQVAVQGSRAFLYSVFHNLLSNAIKYRWPKRPLKVEVKCLAHTANGTIISIADNGSGIDMVKAGDNLFKLYKRFHSHTEGRGIGLYLVKTHMESMGGFIEVSSQPKEGTRFLLYFK